MKRAISSGIPGRLVWHSSTCLSLECFLTRPQHSEPLIPYRIVLKPGLVQLALLLSYRQCEPILSQLRVLNTFCLTWSEAGMGLISLWALSALVVSTHTHYLCFWPGILLFLLTHQPFWLDSPFETLQQVNTETFGSHGIWHLWCCPFTLHSQGTQTSSLSLGIN